MIKMMEFLYFPEDKTEYIPAAISFFMFFLGAVLVFFLFKRASNKEMKKVKELEKKLNEQNIHTKP
jgi:preprotein translocase subunit YajC